MIDLISPRTKNRLRRQDEWLVDGSTNERVARIVLGIPRFVSPDENYSTNFGWQWNRWENVQSETRGGTLKHAQNLRYRSGLWDGVFPTRGMSLLECGMGGGDDTEVLLTLPLKELHAFDMSNSVERARKYLNDPRLTICQASIFDMPYPEESFDIVWCHRVLQHTPDPELAMRLVARKVKLGGFLFVHCYKRSRRYMKEFKYKYRWITKNLSHEWIYKYVETAGPYLHRLNRLLSRSTLGAEFCYRFIPFYKSPDRGIYSEMNDADQLEWEKLATFDALTPKYDNPMTTEQFCGILESEGFDIVKLLNPSASPLIAQAIKRVV